MNPRTNYEMTDEDLKIIIKASKSVPVIKIGMNSFPSSPQENANRAWRNLGEKMGVDFLTVRPIDGKDFKHFSAIPSETNTVKV